MKQRATIPRAEVTLLALALAVALGGCSSPGPPAGTATEAAEAGAGVDPPAVAATAADNPLAGTDWRLVEIQSMDDAIGTVRPEDPSRFTLSLGADGTAALRLDCNRATGAWSAEPGADGQSGRFAFGPLAATQAACPPPHLGEQIAAQAQYVRSFMLSDGRLYLSLMADGGIYAWEPLTPAGVPFETAPDEAVEAAILAASPDYTRAIVGPDGIQARYVYSRFDLDGDGSEEILVYMLGSIFCGSGGCDLLLLKATESGYVLVNSFPISRTPVIASNAQTQGWNDLFRPESGGGAAASFVRHAFNGETYVEQERLPRGAAPDGTPLLTGELSYQTGIPLAPRE